MLVTLNVFICSDVQVRYLCATNLRLKMKLRVTNLVFVLLRETQNLYSRLSSMVFDLSAVKFCEIWVLCAKKSSFFSILLLT